MSERVGLLSAGVPDPTQGGSGIFNDYVVRELLARGHRVDALFRVADWFLDMHVQPRHQRELEERGLHAELLPMRDQPGRFSTGSRFVLTAHDAEFCRASLRRFAEQDGPTKYLSLDLGWALALAETSFPCVSVLGDPVHRRLLETLDTVGTRKGRLSRRVRLATVPPAYRLGLRRRLARFNDDPTAVLGTFAPQHAQELRDAGIACRHFRWFSPGPEVVERRPPADRLVALHVGTLETTASRQMLAFWRAELYPRLAALEREVEIRFVGRSTQTGEERPARNVTLVYRGHRDDLAAEFAEANVYLAPMRYPVGVRTRVVTALAHGIPVVTDSSTALGLPELEDGRDVVYADASEAIARALGGLAEDRAAAEALGAAGRRAWERWYDPAVNVPALLEPLGL